METESSTFQVEDPRGVCRNPGNSWACYHYNGNVECGREGTDKNGLCKMCSEISNPIFDCEAVF
jgi:hypothetical protein